MWEWTDWRMNDRYGRNGSLSGHALLKNIPQASELDRSSSRAIESIVKHIFSD